MDIVARCRTFRRLHESGCFVIPNPWDMGSARLLATWRTPGGWRYWSSVNNTDVGLWYTAASLGFFLFAGLHADYHRPSDESERIDPDKAARVARLAFYLAHAPRLAAEPSATAGLGSVTGTLLDQDELPLNKGNREQLQHYSLAYARFHSNIDVAPWGMPVALLETLGLEEAGLDRLIRAGAAKAMENFDLNKLDD